MNSWANQRKFIILMSIFSVLLIVVGVTVYFLFFNVKPTCFDNKKNGDELGVDCGGSMCLRVCQSQAATPLVHFARAFQVSSSTYNAVAEVENLNPAYIGLDAQYSFKLYNADNVLIGERDGSATLLPHKVFTIFEAAINTGYNTPARIFFNVNSVGEWQKSSYNEPLLQISNQIFSGTTTSPRLEADIQNTTLSTLSNVAVVALLYDQADNVIGSSRTFTDTVGPNGTAHVIFTWPAPFAENIAKIEIQTEVLPENVSQ